MPSADNIFNVIKSILYKDLNSPTLYFFDAIDTTATEVKTEVPTDIPQLPDRTENT